MKPMTLFFILTFLSTSVFAQKTYKCDQLTIDFQGIVESEENSQIFIEVSNFLYTGELYYYPGFVLLNEEGDTIAKEEVTYYGIGTNFQTHLLNLHEDISFPFVGELKLFGSFYQNLFCSFPVEIEDLSVVSRKEIENAPIKVAVNFAGDQLVLDLGGNYSESEQTDYYFNITNEDGKVVHNSNLSTKITSIAVDSIGDKGYYFVSVWNNVSKKLLPTKQIWVD